MTMGINALFGGALFSAGLGRGADRATGRLAALEATSTLVIASPALADDVCFGPVALDGSLGFQGVETADVDGDGDIDILGAAFNANDITWWENTAGDGTVWIEHTVDANFDGAHSVHGADVDGDGDIDILGAAYYGDTITWWENTAGDGAVWIEHIVADFNGAYAVHAVDVDGDGDMDVVGGSYQSGVTLWENTLGDGTAWTKRVLPNSFEAWFVDTADVDGDGDIDVLAGSWFQPPNEIAWWENTAGDGTDWTRHCVAYMLARSAYAADIDGDGDVDILGAANGLGNYTTWWENTIGDGTVWVEHIVDGGFLPYSVHAADIDGDGHVDILGGWFTDDITWWENTPGCVWDLLGDCSTGADDLQVLLGAWGKNPGHSADFNGDGNVGTSDLIELLGNWGPCP